MGSGAAGCGGRRRLRTERRLPRRPGTSQHRLRGGDPLGRDRPPARRAAHRPRLVRQRPQVPAPLPRQAVPGGRAGGRPRAAGIKSRRLAQAAADPGSWDGVLPEVTLLVEWPDGAEAPTDYWLSNLPADTPVVELVRLAKIRWRIEHDYRELKHGLGLDHFEGRSWTGWHHHVTLVTAAHAFLTEQRLAPKADTADSPSTRSSTPFRTC